MMDLLIKGGPIMAPLLLVSIITLAVVIERIIFIFMEMPKRNKGAIEEIFKSVEAGDISAAITKGSASKDFIAQILAYGLKNKSDSLENALLFISNKELKRRARGLSILDTAITLAPLLGLLGTVTGLIRSFQFLGNQELGTPTAITGGIAEALIATACGLSIAITALLPFNYLNTSLEEARDEIERSTTQLELLLARHAR
jgi:biopolymer transport protein ExbB